MGRWGVSLQPGATLPHFISGSPPFFLSFLLTFRGRRAVTVRSEVTSHPTLLAAPAAAGPAASCRPGSCRRRGALCSPLWLQGENTDSADGFVHRSLSLSLAAERSANARLRCASARPRLCVAKEEIGKCPSSLTTQLWIRRLYAGEFRRENKERRVER